MSQSLQNEGAQRERPAHCFQVGHMYVACCTGWHVWPWSVGMWRGIVVEVYGKRGFGGTTRSSLAAHVLATVTAIGGVKCDTAVLSMLGCTWKCVKHRVLHQQLLHCMCCEGVLCRCCPASVAVGTCGDAWEAPAVTTSKRVCAALLLKLACRRIYSLQTTQLYSCTHSESGPPAQPSLL